VLVSGLARYAGLARKALFPGRPWLAIAVLAW